jgi:hypothetical protein
VEFGEWHLGPVDFPVHCAPCNVPSASINQSTLGSDSGNTDGLVIEAENYIIIQPS